MARSVTYPAPVGIPGEQHPRRGDRRMWVGHVLPHRGDRARKKWKHFMSGIQSIRRVSEVRAFSRQRKGLSGCRGPPCDCLSL